MDIGRVEKGCHCWVTDWKSGLKVTGPLR
jgi:hypothetical protein